MINLKSFFSHLFRAITLIDRAACMLTLALYEAIRPQLGPVGTCIYSVSCGDFARAVLSECSFPIALVRICWRLITCNPITALIRKFT